MNFYWFVKKQLSVIFGKDKQCKHLDLTIVNVYNDEYLLDTHASISLMGNNFRLELHERPNLSTSCKLLAKNNL